MPEVTLEEGFARHLAKPLLVSAEHFLLTAWLQAMHCIARAECMGACLAFCLLVRFPCPCVRFGDVLAPRVKSVCATSVWRRIHNVAMVARVSSPLSIACYAGGRENGGAKIGRAAKPPEPPKPPKLSVVVVHRRLLDMYSGCVQMSYSDSQPPRCQRNKRGRMEAQVVDV